MQYYRWRVAKPSSIEMNEQQKRLFPSWCDDTTTNYTLCLSDDLDSLLSCIVLKELKGYDISHFYRFDSIGKSVHHGHIKKYVIGVDVDFTKGECWGNHVTMLSSTDNYNKQCANLNVTNNISRTNYTSKFCGSTILQILSYYNVDLSNWTDEQKMILLAIDSSYLPFYSSSFRATGTKWMEEVLEYPELVELTKKYSKADFEQLQKKYNLKSKININGGYLSTNIDLTGLSKVFSMLIELPKQKFNLVRQFQTHHKTLGYNSTINKDEIFSLALTRKNEVKFTVI